MNLVNAPIVPGQKGTEVSNLQEAILFLLQKQAFSVSDTDLINQIATEMQNSFFGSATIKMITALFQVYGRNIEGLLTIGDEDAQFINERITFYAADWDFTLSGSIKHQSGIQLDNVLTVDIYMISLQNSIHMASVDTDNYGNYSYPVSTSATGYNKAYGWQIKTTVAETLYESEVLYNGGVAGNLNIILPENTEVNLKTEYAELLNTITAQGIIQDDGMQTTPPGTLIRNIDISDNSKMLEYLVANTGESRPDIISFVNAFNLAHILGGLDQELIFGMLKQGIPADTAKLMYIPGAVLKKALVISSANRVTVELTDDAEMDDFISTFILAVISYQKAQLTGNAEQSAFFNIVEHAVGNHDDLAQGYLKYYYSYDGNTQQDAFWDGLAAIDEAYRQYIPFLKAAKVIATLTGNNAAITNYQLDALKAISSTNPDPAIIARTTSESNWHDLINTLHSTHADTFFFPASVTGENDEEKTNNYAAQLTANFANAFPTHSVLQRLSASTETTPFPALRESLGSFLSANPDFDLRTVAVYELQDENSSYDFSAVDDKDAFTAQIATVQRLLTVAPNYDTVEALATDGLVSSVDILEQNADDFAAKYASVAGSNDFAAAVYTQAQSNVLFNTAVVIQQYMSAIGHVDFRVTKTPYSDPNHLTADWRNLFGSLDGCTCSQCTSVYSPAAYLTDILRFLRTNAGSVHDALVKQRRPDIQNIELTCKNTNIPVPQIDIVNELLEDIVGSGTYFMNARQTVQDENYQRAIPEYVNANGYTYPVEIAGPLNTTITIPTNMPSPYPKLRNAKYSWSLPYNFYRRQIDTHLDLAGIKLHEVLQRFGSNDPLQAFTDEAFCAAYIGMTDEEKNLVIVNNSNLAPDLSILYGFTDAGGNFRSSIPDPAHKGSYLSVYSSNSGVPAGYTFWRTALSRVDVFLQQTGITYTDLLQLLDCYKVNPLNNGARSLAIIKNDPSFSDDTCQLDQLKINALDSLIAGNSPLNMMYRFVRVAKALNWTFYELDRALTTLSVFTFIDSSAFVKLVQVKRLTELLRISVEDVCTLWSDLSLSAYRDYTLAEPEDIPNQYQRVFYNPLLNNIKADTYPFDANGFITGDIIQASFYNHLSGILNISRDELEDMVGDTFHFDTNGNLQTADRTIAKLSVVYRRAVLIKALKLNVTDWNYYVQWITNANYYSSATTGNTPNYTAFYDTAANPFASPSDTFRFVSLVKLFTGARVSRGDAEFLLLDYVDNIITNRNQTDDFIRKLTELRTGLQKKWYPDYNAAEDKDSKELQKILESISDAEKASKLVAIVERAGTDAPVYTNEDQYFVGNTLSYFLPEEAVIELTDPLNLNANVSYLQVPEDRRQYVFDAIKAYIINKILKPYIFSTLAKEFRMDEDVTDLLLSDCVYDNIPENGYDILLSEDFVNSAGDIVRWDTPHIFYAQFRIIGLLYKASMLISRFGLGYIDVQYMWARETAAVPGIPMLSDLIARSNEVQQIYPLTTGSFVTTFSMLANFIRWMQVRAELGTDMEVLYKLLAGMHTASKSSTLDTLAGLFKTNSEDIAVMLGDDNGNGSLAAVYPAAYASPLLYQRISDCLEAQSLLPATMQVLADIATVPASVTDEQRHASEVVHIVKAQYADKEWLEVIRPVNDQLRMERRDALLAYLLAYPPTPYNHSWLTVDDIYETLMIDVEMEPCMPTTRVLQAVNTSQLWVERVLLNVETIVGVGGSVTPLTLSKTVARQWNSWRRLYRVWEANRKIFLYPENWIEPELRDDKTPFFDELEKYLKQNDVTQETVESAYNTYLERLDQVAHLNIIGVYREVNDSVNANYSSFTYASDPTLRDTIHVFGRTKEYPHIYFYRKRVADVWTAWEKMDVQIDGDHFIPVMWRGRLRLYWLTFTKDQEKSTASAMRGSDEFTTPPAARWQIQLAWTERKDGKWLAKQLSRDAVYSRYIVEEAPVSKRHIEWYEAIHPERTWNMPGDLDRIKQEYINFYCDYDGDNLRFKITERFLGTTTYQMNYWYRTPDSVYNPSIHRYVDQNPLASLAYDVVTEVISGYNYDFSKAKWFFSNTTNLLGFFVAKYSGAVAFNTQELTTDIKSIFSDNVRISVSTDLPNNNYLLSNTDYWYYAMPISGYKHYPDGNIQLFRNAPGPVPGTTNIYRTDANGNSNAVYTKNIIVDREKSKFIVLPRIVPHGYISAQQIQIPYFFYKDYTNSFFVEKVINTVKVGNISIPAPQYRFHNFKYDKVDDFLDQLSLNGIEGLLSKDYINSLNTVDSVLFSAYQPTASVDQNPGMIPNSNVDFSDSHAFSIYNWELFFHIPMLIAGKLMQNQQFEEARKWYQYVFDPTNLGANGGLAQPADFWNFIPFADNANNQPTLRDIMTDPALQANVNRWANDPFNPHLIARTRPSAYMKNVVMKYIDNLIAWADNLFATDTRENINEATMLYVMAAQLLGRRPVQIPARAASAVYTYKKLSALSGSAWNAFSDVLVKIESIMLPSGANHVSVTNKTNGVTGSQMYYFCLPSNDYMLQYWDAIADRLFKIRNCQNINGIERELALFDPPIDPALLVKAAAAGLALSQILSDEMAPLPQYRFSVLSQKATELAQEVKGLGSQLLGALEKKDAESLSLLRSSQEIKVLEAMSDIKQRQVDETQTQIDSITEQQLMTQQRINYYQGLVDGGLNVGEQLQLDSMALNIPLQHGRAATGALASLLHLIPNIMIGALSSGAQHGGQNIGESAGKALQQFGVLSEVTTIIGSMAGIKGGYTRRKEEWQQQLTLANTESVQLEKQLLGAQIRLEVAQLELKTHELQKQNAYDMDEAMRSKYTNEELYNWMIGQVSFTYFQAYKLAVDVAKKAERCYRYELNLQTSDFIQYNYWDSLKKGLMAGEQLAFDIKRMEASYFDLNKRQLELTKHVSLAALDPDALMALRINKACTIDLPEWLFDMDYPAQYMRRIKSVSMTIPCISGPYTTISCKLSLLKSKYRKDDTLSLSGYPEEADDSRFVSVYGNIQSVATSGAQNDSGLFEVNFRDERYLPFEGAGAISTWRIELPAAYAQFDYNSISDIILHVKYTALDTSKNKPDAIKYVQDTVDANAPENASMYRMFSLKQEFSEEWYDMLYGSDKQMFIENMRSRFPYLAQAGDINVAEIELYIDRQDLISSGYTFHLKTDSSDNTFGTPVALVQGDKRYWKTSVTADPATEESWNIFVKNSSGTIVAPQYLKDIWMVVHYTVSPASSAGGTTGSVFNSGSGNSTGTGSVVIPAITDVAPGYSLPVSKMLAWWKADAGVSFIGSNVYTWEDQTRHGNLLTAIPTGRPGFIQNWKNGKPALQFSGGQALSLSTLKIPQHTQDITVILVAEKTDTSTGVCYELRDNTAANSEFNFVFNTGGHDEAYLNVDGTNYNDHGMPVVNPNNKGIYVISYNMSDSNPETSVEFNNVLYHVLSSWGGTTDNVGQAFANNSFNIGASTASTYFGYFNIAELIVLPSKISADERTVIKQYLSDKYDINLVPGLKAWWKSDSGVTSTGGVIPSGGTIAYGGAVQSWHDATGNGYDLTPLSGTGNPTFINGIGGMPGVLFNNNILAEQKGILTDGEDFTVFYVGSSSIGRGIDTGWNYVLAASASDLATVKFAGTGPYNITQPYPSAAHRIVATTFSQKDGASVLTAYDAKGQVISTGTFSDSILKNSATGFVMGSYTGTGINYANGLTYEAMVYNKVLSTAEMQQVLAYLVNKYSAFPSLLIPVVPTAWWNADMGITSSSGKVDTWGDIAGNTITLQPPTSADRPSLVTVNGNQAVSFSSSLLLENTGVLNNTDSFTVFYAGSSSFGRGVGPFANFAIAPTAAVSGNPALGDLVNIVLNQFGDFQYTLTQPSHGSVPVIVAVTVSQAGSNTVLTAYDKNGLVINTMTATSSTLRNASNGICMGQWWNYRIADGLTYQAMIYNRVLNTSEMNVVLTYLRNRYPLL